MNDERTTLEIIASTVKEAKAKGLAELGLNEDQVQIEVLDEGGKGLFGLGSRDARIKITIGSDDSAASTSNKKASRKASPTNGSLLNTVETIEDTVKELLDKMGLQADVEVSIDNTLRADGDETFVVDITGKDLSVLIGRRAETLNAFQYITRLIIGKEVGHGVNLSIDVEGYRERRTQNLTKMAERMANQAIKSGQTMSLEPMSPAERRIIHIALKDNHEVTTRSVDDEPRRKVTIIPE